MEVEAAVVEIDGADGRDPVIGDEDLGVDETGRVLVDAHALLCQDFVEGARHAKDGLFVRDAGGDDADVDVASGSEPEGIYESTMARMSFRHSAVKNGRSAASMK